MNAWLRGIGPDSARHRGAVGARQRGAADAADSGQGGGHVGDQKSLLHINLRGAGR
jgi:hypothetical protein